MLINAKRFRIFLSIRPPYKVRIKIYYLWGATVLWINLAGVKIKKIRVSLHCFSFYFSCVFTVLFCVIILRIYSCVFIGYVILFQLFNRLAESYGDYRDSYGICDLKSSFGFVWFLRLEEEYWFRVVLFYYFFRPFDR